MRKIRFGVALAFLGAAIAGCATAPIEDVAVRPVTATVTNSSGKTITAIRYQDCGADSASWSPIGSGTLPSGGVMTFDIPSGCVNMQAYYPDGRLAGSQSGVRRDFPFTWVIR